MKQYRDFFLLAGGVAVIFAALLFLPSRLPQGNPLPVNVASIPSGIPASSQLAAVDGSGSGLIGWWKFDEGSGATTADSSGNGNNLTLSNATWASGEIGDALSFDGNDSRASAASDLVGTGPVSICAWYYANSATTNAVLAGNGDFSLFVSTSNRFGLSSDGSNDFLSTTGSLVTSAWNHVCATRDASGNGVIYINGALNSSGGTGTPIPGSNFTVGNHPWINEGWSGLVDDVRLYNRVLSGTEVSSIYTEGGGAAAPAPVVSAVTISSINTTGATIGWTTDQQADSQVDYGLTTAYGNSTSLSSSLLTSHSVALSGLTNGATYHYRVDSRNSSGVLTQSSDATFTTSNPGSINGNTLTAASCSQVDVQNAINQATDGMTVMVPAGTCIWTQTVTADLATNPRSVILEGAGIDQTVIQDAVPRTQSGSGPNQQILFVSTTNGKAFRLTGFTFANNPVTTVKNYVGAIDIEGTSKAVRVDHNKFLNLNAQDLLFRGYEFGVADHNTFDTNGTIAVRVYEDQWPGPQGQAASWGDGSWASPLSLGTGQAIYIEDNTITNSSPEGVTDAYGGARLVVRYNDINNDYVTEHGTESSQRERGTRSLEVYGNTMTSNTEWFTPVYIRSGTAVIFDNTMTGYSNVSPSFQLINFRDADTFTPWGTCDGTGPYDENAGVTYATGTQTGATGASTLTDSTKTWTPNQWAGYSVTNITQGWSSMINGNTSNSLAVVPSDFGSTYDWNHGDSYKILKATRCVDQPGAGTSDYISGSPAPSPVGWIHQAIEPLYAWGNTLDSAPMNNFGPRMPNITSGVDFMNNTPRPGYTPYTCPNPLITSGFTSDANPDTSYCQGYVAPPPPTSYSISASAGANGSISPSGSVSVASGGSQKFTVTAASGYQVNVVTVDGSPATLSNGAYTFSNVSANHNISATFSTIVVTATTTNPNPNPNPNPVITTPPSSGGGGGGGGGGGSAGGSVPLPLYLTNVSVTGSLTAGVSVSWTTSAPATSQILYGLTNIYGSQTALSSSLTTSHSLALSGLVANTLYHLNIQSRDSSGNFVTSGDVTFVLSNAGTVSGNAIVPAATVQNSSTAGSTLIPAVSSLSGTGSIAKTLYLTVSDSQVAILQHVLDSHGFPVAASGNGSLGHETLYFGPATEAALEKFQCSKGIVCGGTPATTGYGNTGPKTRAALDALLGASPISTVSNATNVTSVSTAPVAVTVTTKTPTATAAFNRSLTLGSSGADVYALQVFLNTHGFPIALSGSGSRGNESEYFGLATQSALVRFQAAHHISPATGYFGPTTIALVKSLK